MILWFTYVQVFTAVGAGLLCIIAGLAGRRPSDLTVGAVESARAGAVLITRSILGVAGRGDPRGQGDPGYATWTVQMTCMRHTITATASATIPMITVLQRLRSRSAHATPAGGSNAAETR